MIPAEMQSPIWFTVYGDIVEIGRKWRAGDVVMEEDEGKLSKAV